MSICKKCGASLTAASCSCSWLNVNPGYDFSVWTQKGWECPKCGKVYAPFIAQCFSCGNEQIETTDSTTKKSQQPDAGSPGREKCVLTCHKCRQTFTTDAEHECQQPNREEKK